eukprot:3994552-Pyramimonas_sp.AAC.1
MGGSKRCVFDTLPELLARVTGPSDPLDPALATARKGRSKPPVRKYDRPGRALASGGGYLRPVNGRGP